MRSLARWKSVTVDNIRQDLVGNVNPLKMLLFDPDFLRLC